jgi:antitoxin MazE
MVVMQTISKWGNSLAVRIPAPLAESAGLTEGSAVLLRVSAGSLVMEAVHPKYELKKLVAGITRTNRHKQIDWGQPRGKEVW